MPIPLADIQRWMQSAIGGEPVTPANPLGATADVILPSSQMTGEERLAVYQHAYLARLVECLRAEFPMLCRALGQDLFDEFAAGYLVCYPSTSYTLMDLGRQFPEYLAETAPPDAATSWYELLVDLATLECTTSEVFHGPGVEQEPSALAIAPLVLSDSLTLSLAPCVRLLELQYPVHDYYRKLRENRETSPPAAARTLLVVSRLDYTVRHHAVNESQFAILRAFERGEKLTDAIAAAASQTGQDVEQLATLLYDWFVWFAAERFLCNIDANTNGVVTK
jgi:hypothetical protein